MGRGTKGIGSMGNNMEKEHCSIKTERKGAAGGKEGMKKSVGMRIKTQVLIKER